MFSVNLPDYTSSLIYFDISGHVKGRVYLYKNRFLFQKRFIKFFVKHNTAEILHTANIKWRYNQMTVLKTCLISLYWNGNQCVQYWSFWIPVPCLWMFRLPVQKNVTFNKFNRHYQNQPIQITYYCICYSWSSKYNYLLCFIIWTLTQKNPVKKWWKFPLSKHLILEYTS